ncbi:MAG: penicillin-binding protein 2 [Ruminococcaceae bacterium]|nr:penicillin-binding protein 2 [Oscillospiraceae bacterium]
MLKKKDCEFMIKRMKLVFYVTITILFLLVLIVFKISVIDSDKYFEMAVNQRMENIYTKKVRGKIVDRNMIPFVDTNSEIVNNNGVEFLTTKRYSDTSCASHLIGYVDYDFCGISGLEKMYDSFLKTDKKISVSRINDVNKSYVKNLGTRILNSEDGAMNLKLTLDMHIQKIVEEEMDKSVKRGSVVVLDVNSFDVLAISSRPDFDRTNVQKYVENGESELVDRSTSMYNAGSIFKIITAAAALKENMQDEIFLCNGYKNEDGTVFKCHKEDGHMFLNFEEAFVQSCNCAYYEMGKRLKSDKILDMAKKFGLGSKCIGLEWEEEGNIKTEKNKTTSDALNISIGQGDILVTPVQAANIAAIIANKGNGKKVNVADRITDQKGNTLHYLKQEYEYKVIDKSAAEKISSMMKKCVDSGTGIDAKSEIVNISGKTGTAQTGWEQDGELMVHGWFVGFFPSQKPKYAMCVFMENGKSSKNAAKSFKNIAEKIVDLY